MSGAYRNAEKLPESMGFLWEKISGINSDNLGQVITSYSTLYCAYVVIKSWKYFSTSPHMHASESMFKPGLVNPLDMALAEICSYSRDASSSPFFKLERATAFNELVHAYNRSEPTLCITGRKELKVDNLLYIIQRGSISTATCI